MSQACPGLSWSRVVGVYGSDGQLYLAGQFSANLAADSTSSVDTKARRFSQPGLIRLDPRTLASNASLAGLSGRSLKSPNNDDYFMNSGKLGRQ
ncbi:unnamed protein product [Protopolystoma xenopodis]|uniref:Uncharacterized protein n=1 Tax=Protopolystoma xenopodis TaxID=117903 RepID=A0A448XIL0_9PLAT|nr:unnamed protein product [Protopolystoma xenopodis]